MDSAQKWFKMLESESLHFFEEFKDALLNYFSRIKKYKKTTFILFETRLGREESLRAYIRWFNKIALKISSYAMDTKTTVFTQKIKNEDFLFFS